MVVVVRFWWFCRSFCTLCSSLSYSRAVPGSAMRSIRPALRAVSGGRPGERRARSARSAREARHRAALRFVGLRAWTSLGPGPSKIPQQDRRSVKIHKKNAFSCSVVSSCYPGKPNKMVSAPSTLIFGLSHRRARELTFSWRALSESFEKLFCVAGTGFLNDRFGLLIYAARHDNFSAPGEFLASFWTNPSKFCNRTGAS